MSEEPIETTVESYRFECEAGPLENCQHWIALKAELSRLRLVEGRCGDIEGIARAMKKCAMDHNHDFYHDILLTKIATTLSRWLKGA